MENFQENILLRMQGKFEVNEDMVCAILENLQLGRIEDCIKQYSILQQNLIDVAGELDNYPPSDINYYEDVMQFDDELVRKDALEELRPIEERTLPSSPLPKICTSCHSNKCSESACREILNHVEPSHDLSVSDQQDLIKVMNVIAFRFQRQNGDLHQGNGRRRSYRRWELDEIHNVILAMRCCGRDFSKIVTVVEGRSEKMNFSKETLHHILSTDEPLPLPPQDYVPSPGLLTLLKEHKMMSILNNNKPKKPKKAKSTSIIPTQQITFIPQNNYMQSFVVPDQNIENRQIPSQAFNSYPIAELGKKSGLSKEKRVQGAIGNDVNEITPKPGTSENPQSFQKSTHHGAPVSKDLSKGKRQDSSSVASKQTPVSHAFQVNGAHLNQQIPWQYNTGGIPYNNAYAILPSPYFPGPYPQQPSMQAPYAYPGYTVMYGPTPNMPGVNPGMYMSHIPYSYVSQMPHMMPIPQQMPTMMQQESNSGTGSGTGTKKYKKNRDGPYSLRPEYRNKAMKRASATNAPEVSQQQPQNNLLGKDPQSNTGAGVAYRDNADELFSVVNEDRPPSSNKNLSPSPVLNIRASLSTSAVATSDNRQARVTSQSPVNTQGGMSHDDNMPNISRTSVESAQVNVAYNFENSNEEASDYSRGIMQSDTTAVDRSDSAPSNNLITINPTPIKRRRKIVQKGQSNVTSSTSDDLLLTESSQKIKHSNLTSPIGCSLTGNSLMAPIENERSHNFEKTMSINTLNFGDDQLSLGCDQSFLAQATYMNHISEDSNVHLFDGTGDVTLIPGLMNENSFMG